jgi:hypothetical protein
MSTFLPTHPGSLASNFAELGKAARNIATALFAAQERQYLAQDVVKKSAVSPRAMHKSRMQLFAMARECEALSPGQAAELRNLAGRD